MLHCNTGSSHIDSARHCEFVNAEVKGTAWAYVDKNVKLLNNLIVTHDIANAVTIYAYCTRVCALLFQWVPLLGHCSVYFVISSTLACRNFQE